MYSITIGIGLFLCLLVVASKLKVKHFINRKQLKVSGAITLCLQVLLSIGSEWDWVTVIFLLSLLWLSLSCTGLFVELLLHVRDRRATVLLTEADVTYQPPELVPLTDEFEDSTVVITDSVSPADYSRVYTALETARLRKVPATIRLVTTGGEVDSANAIIDLIERFIALGNTARIIASGKCMSAGTMILMAVPVEHRYATKRTSFMIHHVHLAASLGRDERTRRRDEEYIELLTNKANISKESLHALFRSERDYYLTPEEARTLGMIGHIL
ncbi:MAG TPA: ATP-dependent Clp protease proteolytic subunit [Candidatus Saccharimonadales bacterium]|nr:ATP-dependent Clp protease proteolytic subunit [Candidatus Saccharimonadales bacterium]